MVYKKVDFCTLEMDVYAENDGKPVIIYFHGGGLIFGNRREMTDEQVRFFIESGYNVISVDYRLAPETKLVEIVNDLKDAIDFIKTFDGFMVKLDMSKLIYMGRSAGGYLALLLATYEGYAPAAVVSIYGYGSITSEWYKKPSPYYLTRKRISLEMAESVIGNEAVSDGKMERFLYYLYLRQQGKWLDHVAGFDVSLHSEEWKEYSPLERFDGGYPATVLVHGDGDRDVPYEESCKIHKKLCALGVVSRLITVENAGHGFDHSIEEKRVRGIFEAIVDFLNSVTGDRS
ncbi:alpha/beta hydrolase [Fusibacter tunisiensis]|uniref:Acetyl esterase/lipase n=1 Tax=Fusibacter tunisiensis TaxID=1008308 RepID=A0ABS2MPW0_9FIRM|nr:alpha/beta hydrolase [Fusibacter tunisiensis]MBM7561428.1 acetyl esterase/lipase [Fusibacter tunisiensis]